MLSVVLQDAQFSLSSSPWKSLHCFPVINASCIVLYRNCWIIGCITGFRMPRQIAALVSSLFVCWHIVFWVSLRLLFVTFLGSGFFLSSIPLYAIACVRVASLAPCMSNSSGISRSSSSGSCLFAPSLARQSLSSFPTVPLWPFIHWNIVFTVLSLRRWAAFLNSGVFLILIHPLSSHLFRFEVRPSMTYLESVAIFKGWYGAVAAAAAITAAISPTWLDWASPGIHRAKFLGLSLLNHIPLPHLAFCLLLSIHAPSVYTMICLHQGIGPCCLYRLAIRFVVLVGSVNILKHSARSSLHVIDASNVTSLSFSLAI